MEIGVFTCAFSTITIYFGTLSTFVNDCTSIHYFNRCVDSVDVRSCQMYHAIVVIIITTTININFTVKATLADDVASDLQM